MKKTLLSLKFLLLSLFTFLSFSADSQCSINNMTVEVTACEGDLFDITIDLDFSNTSDQFTVKGNGNNYGTFNYADLPISITSLAADCMTEYEFIATDVVDNTCSKFVEWGTVCCDPEECAINSIDFELNPICEDGFIVTEWLIFSENSSEAGFDIYINNEFTTSVDYNGVGPYLFDIEAPDTEFFTIKACDSEIEGCCYTWELENPCYEEVGDCEMTTIDFGPNPICEEGFIVTEWLIAGENVSEVGYDIYINGEFYLFVEYNESDWYDFDIENPGTQNFTIKACDNDNADCCITWELENPCYEEAGDCEMTTIDFGPNPICEEGFIVTEWLIDGENVSEVGYDIYINGEFYLFVEYNESDWYDFAIENPGTQNFTIKACDNDNADCCITWELENPCYEEVECDLLDLDFDVSVCDGDFFEVQVDFAFIGTTNATFDWEIPGVASGNDLFADLPISIGISNSTFSQFTFFAHENDKLIDDFPLQVFLALKHSIKGSKYYTDLIPKITVYDIKLDSWVELASLPTNLYACIANVISKWLIIAGGGRNRHNNVQCRTLLNQSLIDVIKTKSKF